MQDLIAVYRTLASRCEYPLHLGLTEAGLGSKGIVASTAAMAVLLQEGIGDTIRVSLTPEPDGDRTTEVIVAQEILQTMGLRSFMPMVIACPGCGRTRWASPPSCETRPTSLPSTAWSSPRRPRPTTRSSARSSGSASRHLRRVGAA